MRWRVRLNRFDIVASILMFLFIFSPPFIPRLNTVFVLTVIAFIYLIVNRKASWPYARYLCQRLKKPAILYVVAVAYAAIAILYSLSTNDINPSNYIEALYRFFLYSVPTTLCIVAASFAFHRQGHNIWYVVKIIIAAGLIQSAIAVLMLLFPEFRQLLINVMLTNNGIDIATIPPWELGRRYYAFSDSVFDTFGYGTGIIASLPLFYYLKKRNYKVLVTVPFLLLLPLLNSVTGLVFFVVGLTLYIITLIAQAKGNVRSVTAIVFTTIVSILSIITVVSIVAPQSYDWAAREISATVTLGASTRGNITTFGKLFNPNFWQLPTGSGIVVGTGHTVYNADGFNHSDVGYVNSLWLMGVIGSLLLYVSIALLYCIAYKNAKHDGILPIIVIFLFICFALFEIKGMGISFSPGSAVSLFLIMNIAISHFKDDTSRVL